MINVVIVDDHALVRLGMKRLLEDVRDISVIGEAESGEAAINLVKETKPDVVLMDLKMPGIGGLDATRRLIRVNPKLKIIVVTVCSEGPFPDRLVRAGAAGSTVRTTRPVSASFRPPGRLTVRRRTGPVPGIQGERTNMPRRETSPVTPVP